MRKYFVLAFACALIAAGCLTGCGDFFKMTILDSDIDKKVVNAPNSKLILDHAGTIWGEQLSVHGQIRDSSGRGDLTGRYGRITKTLAAKTNESDINKIVTNQYTHLDSAGLYFSFYTNTKTLAISGKFSRPAGQVYAVNEDSSLNCRYVSGHFDLYKMVAGEWVYVGTVKGQPGTTQDFSGSFNLNNSGGAYNKYLLLFPLYNGVQYVAGAKAGEPDQDIKLSVDADCFFTDAEFMGESTRKPILIYGTSITQGAAPSHVGEAYTHRIMLTLKREVINMGFSGSAYMSESMGNFISGIDASIFIIDPTMNHTVGRASDFIGQYRAKHATTPIVLVSQFDNNNTLNTERDDGEKMKTCYEAKKTAGDENIYFVSRINEDGSVFVPTFENDTGNIHPDTAGMKEWARRIMAVIKENNIMGISTNSIN